MSANEIVWLSHWLSRAVPFPDSSSSVNARPGPSSSSPVCALPPLSPPVSCLHQTPWIRPGGLPVPGQHSTAHRAQAAPGKPTLGSLWCAKPHSEPTGAPRGLSKLWVINKRNKNPNQHRAEPAQPRSCSVPTTHNLHAQSSSATPMLKSKFQAQGLVKPIKMSLKTAFKKLPGQGQLLN